MPHGLFDVLPSHLPASKRPLRHDSCRVDLDEASPDFDHGTRHQNRAECDTRDQEFHYESEVRILVRVRFGQQPAA